MTELAQRRGNRCRSIRNLAPALLLILAALAFWQPVGAATFTVSVFADTASGGLAGTGTGAAGDLRAQILAANLVGGTNTIVFSCPSAPCTITLNGPLPPITSNLTIDGGALGSIVIDGSGAFRVFFVDTGKVALNNLYIQNGLAQGGRGGNAIAGGGGGAGLGGCLFINQSTAAVAMTNVGLLNCRAAGGKGGNVFGNNGAGGGGGLAFRGGDNSSPYCILLTPVGAGGGGGILGQGADAPGPSCDTNSGNGGIGGGGGGGGEAPFGAGTAGTGGGAFATNPGGLPGNGFNGGAGGFGGGGGGAQDGIAGNGGFGGGGGGSWQTPAAGRGGPGGGGGAGGLPPAIGGSLGSGVIGGAGGLPGSQGSGAGGGAAAGPAVFINEGSLTVNSAFASGSSVMPGSGGFGYSQDLNGFGGTAAAASIFNYGGRVNNSSVTGPNTTLDPPLVSTTISVRASASPLVFGQTVTFTATVSQVSGSVVPTGTVLFCLDGYGTFSTGGLSAGQASVTVSWQNLGIHTITAIYLGDGYFRGSISNPLAGNTAPVPSTTVLSTGTEPSVFGQSITVTALVSSPVFLLGTTADGVVQFSEGGSILGTAILSVRTPGYPESIASLTTSALSGGSHLITANYLGSASYQGSTGSVSKIVNRAPQTIAFSALGNQTYGAAPFTISAAASSGLAAGFATLTPAICTVSGSTVSILGAGTCTIAASQPGNGNYSAAADVSQNFTVNKATLSVTANNAARVYGATPPTFTATIRGFVNGDTTSFVSGAASLTTTATATSNVANYPITAAPGTLTAANYNFAFINGVLAVTKADTAVALSNSRVNLLATVAPVPPGAGAPSGTVQFLIGSTLLGTIPLAASAATLTSSPGSIVAVYSGDGNFNGSTSNPLVVYPPGASSLSLRSSLNPSALGQAVTFTASVGTDGGPPSATASGNVQFFDGALLLGSAFLSSGHAAFTTTALTGGLHNITARYSGDSVFPSAQGIYGGQMVNTPLTLSVTASPVAPVFGQSVVLSATVTATALAGFAAPTGQVTFREPATTLFGQNTTLGTAPLTAATANFSLNNLGVGTHTIAASYSGDGVWSPDARTTTVTVALAPTSTSLSLSIGSAGQVVMNASITPVAPGRGVPTGKVQFVNIATGAIVANAVLEGASSTATTTPSAAMFPIEAVYSGDVNFKGSASAPLPAAVNAASNLPGSFAPDEIAVLFGIAGLSGDLPATLPMATSLGGVTVKITDGAGETRMAPIYGAFGSTGQINFMIPTGTAPGTALATIALPGDAKFSTVLTIAESAPGIFTANANGAGVYAGQVVHVHADGTQSVGNPASLTPIGFVPAPIDLGPPGDQVFLVLYGTGIRHAATLTATVNRVQVPVLFFGSQETSAGLDQINIGLPRTLVGAGLVEIVISAGGQTANPVTAAVQ